MELVHTSVRLARRNLDDLEQIISALGPGWTRAAAIRAVISMAAQGVHGLQSHLGRELARARQAGVDAVDGRR